MNKKSVLFLCIHNSARSQMAEAYLSKFGAEHFIAESAGLEPGTLNPLAVEALQEDGIDISKNNTKDVFTMAAQGRAFNYVITVCDAGNAERCPHFAGLHQKLHWNFADPSSFTGTHQQKLEQTIAVRNNIKEAVLQFIQQYNN